MPVRASLSEVARHVQMTLSRASVREFDDKHLMQQIKTADVYHSETPTDFERWQMVGLTAMPLKQEQTQETQKTTNDKNEQGDWNHDQPTGKSAEVLMLYLGSRSHPVGLADDRRVRPYAMKEGETACYAASGTGQMLFHNQYGTYIVACNNPPEQSQDNQETERYASLRHVTKKKQSREIKEGQEVQEHKHEGETVNTEVRTTSKRVEVYDGNTLVGYYDKTNKEWVIGPGTTAHIGIDGRWVNIIGDKVWLGEPNKDSTTGARVATEAGLSEKVYAVV